MVTLPPNSSSSFSDLSPPAVESSNRRSDCLSPSLTDGELRAPLGEISVNRCGERATTTTPKPSLKLPRKPPLKLFDYSPRKNISKAIEDPIQDPEEEKIQVKVEGFLKRWQMTRVAEERTKLRTEIQNANVYPRFNAVLNEAIKNKKKPKEN